MRFWLEVSPLKRVFLERREDPCGIVHSLPFLQFNQSLLLGEIRLSLRRLARKTNQEADPEKFCLWFPRLNNHRQDKQIPREGLALSPQKPPPQLLAVMIGSPARLVVQASYVCRLSNRIANPLAHRLPVGLSSFGDGLAFLQ